MLAYVLSTVLIATVTHNLDIRQIPWQLLSAALIVFTTGLLDDLIELKPWQKLLTEILAGTLAYYGGIQIHSIGGNALPTLLALPLTVLWIVACTNALNLIDGLDGLAAGIGLLVSLTSMAAGLLHGNPGLVVATAPLAGALLGFLVFNFNPASIFLGDGGSLWTGFMLACFGVIWSTKSVPVLSISAPLMALSLPLLDTLLAILRRFLRSQSIFTADREHIHHRLLDRGLSPKRAVLVLYFVSAVGACFSLLQSTATPTLRILLTFGFLIVVWRGIQYCRYQEFGVLARILRSNGIRSLVKCELSLCRWDELLRNATTVESCWSAVRRVGLDLGFSHAELKICGHQYREQFSANTDRCWVLHVPLSASEHVSFMCPYEFSRIGTMAPVVEMLHRGLSSKFSRSSEMLTEADKAMSASVSKRSDQTNVITLSPRSRVTHGQHFTEVHNAQQ